MDEETVVAFLLMQETEVCKADTVNEESNTHLTAALLITDSQELTLDNFYAMNGEIQHEIISAVPSSSQALKQAWHGECCLTARMTVHILQQWVLMRRPLN